MGGDRGASKMHYTEGVEGRKHLELISLVIRSVFKVLNGAPFSLMKIGEVSFAAEQTWARRIHVASVWLSIVVCKSDFWIF